jgi:2-haloacid dehalogenase
MTPLPVKAVLFDAYGTLFDVHAPVARLAAEIGPNAKAMSELWRAKHLQYLWLRSLMGAEAHTDFYSIMSDGLDYALAQYGIDDRALRDKLLKLYMTLDAYPDAVSCLRNLRDKGIATGILSNGWPDMLASAVASAGLTGLLDRVLSMESVGTYKPHPRAYRLGEDELHLPPAEIGFVSANGWDTAGGAHYGFKVVHLNRAGLPAERLPAQPALVVKSLDEAAAGFALAA